MRRDLWPSSEAVAGDHSEICNPKTQSVPGLHTSTNKRERKKKNMLAQVDNTHMHTNCFFSFINPLGQKLHMQAFYCLTGAGQTWLGDLRIFATHTHTQWLVITLCKGRRTWSICRHRAKTAEKGVGGKSLLCFVGRWEGTRHRC